MSDEHEKKEAEALNEVGLRWIEDLRKKFEDEFLRGEPDPSFSFFEETLAKFRKESE